MTSITLDSDNCADVVGWLHSGSWVVACLCAAWCGTCRQYRDSFDTLATRHPDKHFVWIDIEDQADMVGDLDVENFPTLLIQRRDTVTFFGEVLPDFQLADRLIQAQAEKSDEEIRVEATHPSRRLWKEYDLLKHLK